MFRKNKVRLLYSLICVAAPVFQLEKKREVGHLLTYHLRTIKNYLVLENKV
jgi:hypothetical protein